MSENEIQPNRFYSTDELRAILHGRVKVDALQDQPEGWKVLPGVALQGFLALRVTETLRLTWDRVDFGKCTIFIDGETKNKDSRRILPMPTLLGMILEDAPKDGDRVVSVFGRMDSWRNALAGSYTRDDEGKPKLEPGFMEVFEPGSYILPKNFRKVLSTESEERLWNDRVLDDFYGHARKGTRRKLYSIRDLEKIVPLFRAEVTDKIDEVLAKATEEWCRVSGEVVSLRQRYVKNERRERAEGLS